MKSKLKEIRKKINELLVEIETEFGYTASTEYSISYDGDGSSFTINKLEFLKGTKEEVLENKVQEAIESLKRFAKINGLKDTNIYGKEVELQGDVFTISGFRPNARTRSILIKDKNGKEFNISNSWIVEVLKELEK